MLTKFKIGDVVVMKDGTAFENGKEQATIKSYFDVKNISSVKLVDCVNPVKEGNLELHKSVNKDISKIKTFHKMVIENSKKNHSICLEDLIRHIKSVIKVASDGGNYSVKVGNFNECYLEEIYQYFEPFFVINPFFEGLEDRFAGIEIYWEEIEDNIE